MNIDRKRFLLFTAAIQASACTGHAPVEPPERDPLEEAEAPVFSELEPGGASARDWAGKPQVAGPVNELGPIHEYGPISEGGIYAGPTHEAGLYHAPISEVAAAGAGHASSKVHPACAGFKPPPGPHCESFSDNEEMCSTVQRAFKAKTAGRFTACLEQKSGTKAMCKFNGQKSCLAKAFSATKGSSSSKKYCRDTAAMCKKSGQPFPETNATCVGALDTVTKPYESRLRSCIAEFCEVSSCLWYLE
jgi:hypothetical protein